MLCMARVFVCELENVGWQKEEYSVGDFGPSVIYWIFFISVVCESLIGTDC